VGAVENLGPATGERDHRRLGRSAGAAPLCRLLEAFPILPLIAKVSLAVGALSYAGEFNIMAVADRDICTDFDVFVASAQSELQALAATCASRPRFDVG